jgi:hypothetical protein
MITIGVDPHKSTLTAVALRPGETILATTRLPVALRASRTTVGLQREVGRRVPQGVAPGSREDRNPRRGLLRPSLSLILVSIATATGWHNYSEATSSSVMRWSSPSTSERPSEGTCGGPGGPFSRRSPQLRSSSSMVHVLTLVGPTQPAWRRNSITGLMT